MAAAGIEKPSVIVFGLAVMGSNLARNIVSRGIPLGVYNRSSEVTEKFIQEHNSENFTPLYSLDELVEKTESPRKILLMIKAGKPVDAVLKDLLPKLTMGDIVMDGGNAFYRDTQRRVEECKKHGVHFLGVGISGGEEGALKGPSIMPGGEEAAWNEVEPLLTQIAADYKGEPCAQYLGPDGAGHFVKMVHNGIEYADMQLIAEVYHLMKLGLSIPNDEIGHQFAEWNKGRLSSYLLEITAEIFHQDDPEGNGKLIDVILDKAGQKGTGRWTSQESLEFGVPIPTIASAVDARGLSALKEERETAEHQFHVAHEQTPLREVSLLHEFVGERSTGFNLLEQALYVGKVLAYAQGLSLIRTASEEFGWELKLDRVASLWRAGCIIRASMLQDIMTAYREDPELKNLVLYPGFTDTIKESLPALRTIVSAGALSGIPLPGLSSALNYIDAYTSSRLPQNLIQAQRDFFGAHTYERIDREGSFHTEWE